MLEVLRKFDPYYEWLAIPRNQRPPTHYQLLGIAPSEQDADAVDEAALRRMAVVRAHETGEHAADCQRVLSEITQARMALLNPPIRRDYDATQEQQTGIAAVPALANAATAQPLTAPPAGKSGFTGGMVFAAAVVVLALVAGIVGPLLWQSRTAKPQPETPAIVNVPEKQDKNSEGPQKKDPRPGEEVPAGEDPDGVVDVPTKPVAKESGRQRTYNLLPLIDLTMDVVEGKGKWRMQDRLLHCDVGHFVPRVQIRYVPPEEYDFSVSFVQKQLRNGVSLIMPKPGGGTFFWTVGFRHGIGFGLGAEGRNGGGNLNGLIQTDTLYTTTVQVRRNGVKAFLDGRMLISHPTDFRELDTDGWHRMRNDRILGIACDDPTIFYNVRVVEITGKGWAIP